MTQQALQETLAVNMQSSLRALLAHSIDYAGMFPPATLELEPAVRSYAAYTRSDEAWMLGGFVLPADRFRDVGVFLSEFDEQHPLRISALGVKSKNNAEFAAQLRNVVGDLQQVFETGENSIRIDQIEMPFPSEFDAATPRIAHDALDELDLLAFWETPAEESEKAIALVAEENARCGGHRFGFKLRTGGVTASAFPNSTQIARALVASAANRLPIKFTAGLHHPVRMFRDEVQTKMHGFLNVLGGGVLAIEHEWNEDQTLAMLEDEEPKSFGFTDERFRWREWEIPTASIKRHRALITSFGSCSFDEPREDLRELGLLSCVGFPNGR